MANVTAFPKSRRSADPPPQLFSDPLETGETFDLWRLVSVMRRRIALIAAVMILVPLATAVVVFAMKPIYSASAKLLVTDGGGGAVSIKGFSLPAALSPGQANLPTETAYLTSREFAAQVIERLQLDQLPEFNPHLAPSRGRSLLEMAMDVDALRGPLEAGSAWLAANLGWDPLAAGDAPATDSAASRDAEFADVTDIFLDRLEIDGEQLSRSMTIRFRSTDPDLAALVPNTIADMYLDGKQREREATVNWSSKRLADQVAELQARVQEAEQKLERFRRQEGILDGRGTDLLRQQLVKLNDQLVQATTERAEKEARLKQMQGLTEKPDGTGSLAAVLSSPLISNLRLRESQIQQRLAELRTTLRDNHPDVVKTRREIEEASAAIEAEIAKVMQSMRNEAEIARVRERNLAAAVAEVKAAMELQGESEVEMRALEAEAKANQSLYEVMLSRMTAVALEGVGPEQAGAEVISRAVAPRDPVAPKKKVAILASFLAAAVLAALLALGLDFLIRGFKNAKQIEHATGLPVIASIPLTQQIEDEGVPLFEIVRRRPGSAVGQGIRKLRTALNLIGEGKPNRVVLITSSIAGEGKSSIALALVVNAVSASLRSLIVDCDTVNASVTKQLGQRNANGLRQFLNGDAEIDDIIEFDTATGVHYIATGGTISNSDDLYASRKMAELLRYAARHFDFTVLDSGPASVVSDTLVLVPQADATIFVIEWEKTRRETAEQSIKEVYEVGENLAGIVMSKNDLRVQSIDGGAESYDGQYYGADRRPPDDSAEPRWGAAG